MDRTRYRCTACGNLSRFDVVSTRRTRAYHHFTVGGDLRIEDEAVLAESVDSVTCRWCGTGTAVERVDETVGAGESSGSKAVTDAGAS